MKEAGAGTGGGCWKENKAQKKGLGERLNKLFAGAV